jgi:hypothetical protein
MFMARAPLPPLIILIIIAFRNHGEASMEEEMNRH